MVLGFFFFFKDMYPYTEFLGKDFLNISCAVTIESVIWSLKQKMMLVCLN